MTNERERFPRPCWKTSDDQIFMDQQTAQQHEKRIAFHLPWVESYIPFTAEHNVYKLDFRTENLPSYKCAFTNDENDADKVQYHLYTAYDAYICSFNSIAACESYIAKECLNQLDMHVNNLHGILEYMRSLNKGQTP